MKEPIRVALCPACGACPEVVLDVSKDEARIGEEGNLVRLRIFAYSGDSIRNSLLTTAPEGV